MGGTRSFFGRVALALAVVAAGAWVVRCSQAYKDPTTGPGQQLVIDEVNNDLTSGNCAAAINLLTPIINGGQTGTTFMLLYSSAYACLGGLSMPNIIGSLNNTGGTDIWTLLIKSDYSNGQDGHLADFDKAMNIIFTAAGTKDGGARTNDENVYMIFLAAMDIATVISPAGQASPTTGAKGVSIAGDNSVSDECHAEVALAEIEDSLKYVQAGSGLSSLSSSINTICNQVAGGCPTNEDYTSCTTDPVLQNQGKAVLVAIDQMWQ
jgi:hypothetical protein